MTHSKITIERWMMNGIMAIVMFIMMLIFTSCGTVVGGRLQACQKRKPAMDHREIRPLAFVGDILLAPIAFPIDFYTGGIYKPCNRYQVQIQHKEPLMARVKAKFGR